MLTKYQQSRHNLRRHQITPEMKAWLVLGHQKSVCPVCLLPIGVSDSHIDHCHECRNKANHKVRQGSDCACPQCIRGALHSECNRAIVYYLEKFPHLQNDHIKNYLQRRPFFGIKGESD